MNQSMLFRGISTANDSPGKRIVLRDYQEEAVASIFSEWELNASTLCVMPTGCGKSVVFSAVIKQYMELESDR